MNPETPGDPTSWDVWTWVLAIVMAVAGGLINVFDLIKTGERKRISILSLIGEVFSAGFVGIGVMMLLLSYGYPLGMAAFSACVMGHFSTRLLFKIESLIEYKLDKMAGKDE